ncbi:MAG: ribbon-helix-helix domain-containing protein [Actinomycetota bacterium]|nr:ribbon-helix-helix domain-containing protein [Actinomycetota bacterium]
MGGRKTEILSFSVPPEMKKKFKELAEEQGMEASELFREMVRV